MENIKPKKVVKRQTDPELQIEDAIAGEIPLKIEFLDGTQETVIVIERDCYTLLAVSVDGNGPNPFIIYKHALKTIRHGLRK